MPTTRTTSSRPWRPTSAQALSVTWCGVEVSSSASSRDGRAPAERTRCRPDSKIFASRARSTCPSSSNSQRSTGPSSSSSRGSRPSLRASHRRRATHHAIFDEIRRGHVLVHQPYGSSLRELRGLRPRRPSATRTSIAMKTAGLPHERRQRPRGVAHPVRRGGQAVRAPRRTEGPLRRAPQHRVVESAGASGLSTSRTGSRISRPTKDAHIVLVRGTRFGATPTSAPCIPRGDRPRVRGPRSLHRRRGDHCRRRGPLQLHHRLRAPTEVPQAPRRPVHAPQRPRRRDSRRRGGGRRKHARIRLKLNHLVDPKIVEELYAASRAGAN